MAAPPDHEVIVPVEPKPEVITVTPIDQIAINGDRYSFIDKEARSSIDKAKPVYATFTIPTSGWTKDGTSGYPSFHDFTVSGLTTSDRVDVVIDVASVNNAVACGMCPTTEALAGKFRIRTQVVPPTAITAQYQITKG